MVRIKPKKRYRKRIFKRGSKVELPHTYFWNIAKSPIMIYNGRIYHLSITDSERESNIIKINGQAYGFDESETLVDLEALYNTDFSKEIDTQKTEFINAKLKDALSGHIKWKLKSLNKIKESIQNNAALLLIIEKIIPEIEGKNPLKNIEEYANKLPEGEIDSFKEKISEVERVVLDDKIKKLEIKGVLVEESVGTEINNEKDRSILGKYVFHNFNIIVLSPSKMHVFSSKRSANKANINGYSYNLQEYKEYSSIDAIETIYLDLLEHTFNFEALENVDKTIEGLEEVYRQEALLKQIIRGEEFHGTNGGFYRHSSGKFVFYMNFPQFANKFPDGRYVIFPPGKIAIGANYDPQKKDFAIIRDSITILNRYRHPFIKPFDEDTDESHFCIGTYALHQKMPGYEKVPQTLVELKTLLMSGYNNYHRNIENVYNHYYNYHTKSEITKKGIPITNEEIVVSETIRKKYEEPIEDDEE